MALWEYKAITSGKGGFASPSLLETYLNQLGKDEWEIISFHSQPDNPLAFTGLARRPTQREWTLEAAVAAAAKAEADKIRAELIQRQHSGQSLEPAAEADEPAEKPLGAAAEGLRKLRDTDRDLDPDAPDEPEGDDWENWDGYDDDLPTFFEAIKPHLRRNQKGPGQSVGIDYLAKRWEQAESDLVAAIKECGFVIPETEDEPPVYLEFEGDLYWVNRGQRGALFLNTREKPRPAFRAVPAQRLDPADPAAAALAEEHAADVAERKRRGEEQAARDAESAARRAEHEARRQEEAARRADEQAAKNAAFAAASEGPLPAGPELLDLLRPLMRRNRRGPGLSGSTSFLAKALRHTEEELVAALAAQGIAAPEKPDAKPVFVEVGPHLYWLNRDNRGGHWINTREQRERREAAPGQPEGGVPAVPASASEAPVVEASAEPAPSEQPALAAVRLLLAPNKRGSGVSGEIAQLATELGRSEDDLVAALVAAGLAVPAPDADAEEKPVFVEHGPEIFWLKRAPRGGSLWLHAKESKSAAKKSGPRPRSRRGGSKPEAAEA